MSEVSEVVSSETPFFKPHQVPILTPEINTHLPQLQNPPQNFETKVPIEETSEVISHLSETCSMTESFSAATTATTATATTTTITREEEEATSKHNINHKWDRSPSRKRPHVADGNLAGVRERRLKSPARRPEPSPEKKVKNGPRPLRGRESGPAANRRRNAGPATLRRDSGESSGRRSRSPACARTGKVAAGAVGGRKEVVAPANGVEKEKLKEKEKKSESEEVVGDQNDDVSPEECLENPHVSMECFIFL